MAELLLRETEPVLREAELPLRETELLPRETDPVLRPTDEPAERAEEPLRETLEEERDTPVRPVERRAGEALRAEEELRLTALAALRVDPVTELPRPEAPPRETKLRELRDASR